MSEAPEITWAFSGGLGASLRLSAKNLPNSQERSLSHKGQVLDLILALCPPTQRNAGPEMKQALDQVPSQIHSRRQGSWPLRGRPSENRPILGSPCQPRPHPTACHPPDPPGQASLSPLTEAEENEELEADELLAIQLQGMQLQHQLLRPKHQTMQQGARLGGHRGQLHLGGHRAGSATRRGACRGGTARRLGIRGAPPWGGAGWGGFFSNPPIPPRLPALPPARSRGASHSRADPKQVSTEGELKGPSRTQSGRQIPWHRQLLCGVWHLL